jgi:uncharacterized protein YcfJ
MTAVLSTTLIALAVIGVVGAALLTGHATFDQFVTVVGAFGGGTSLVHVTSSLKTTGTTTATNAPSTTTASS